ncbi:MAG TPA: hypothetical protein VNX29_09085 [Kaistia sp.]|nr:hypothetical protein [Kaistia sp.]
MTPDSGHTDTCGGDRCRFRRSACGFEASACCEFRLLDATGLDNPANRYLNRIERGDLIQAAVASKERGSGINLPSKRISAS